MWVKVWLRLRLDATFAVLVTTAVGTFSVSKLVVMDAVCIGGEGSRVYRASPRRAQTTDFFPKVWTKIKIRSKYKEPNVTL